jgi:EAL domain-containing protein (putative c-di-GMP-specific phosphodiesterase class I)/GGDEF domain-containing protein
MTEETPDAQEIAGGKSSAGPGLAPRSRASLKFIDDFLKQGSGCKMTGLLLGQLDAFNRISATFGQAQSAAFCDDYCQRLRTLLPPSTPIIRLSERRVAILLGIDSMTTLLDVASTLADEQPPMYTNGADMFLVDITLGISVHPTHAHNAAELFRRAELALNQARTRELSNELYRTDATQQQAALWKFTSELEQAVQNGDLEVYLQPKVNIATGTVAGAEALVRWRQKSGRLVLPSDFIPLAERSGSVVPITWLVFDQIAAIASEWNESFEDFSLAVNVSSQVLDHVDFTSRLVALRDVLSKSNIDLEPELTEESLVETYDQTSSRPERIRKLGVGRAIDDFGKGYSSLTYLKDIPATEIKIDKKFVGTIATDEKDWHIVKATMDLAHAFGMRIVAEGVDNPDSLRVLAELG